MDVVFTPGAGWEVPEQTVMACRVTPAPRGHQVDGRMEVRALGPLTRAWLAWSDGLTAAGSTQVARERPGASWNPVSNLREGPGTVCLVHAAQVKHVPGRKPHRAEARGRA